MTPSVAQITYDAPGELERAAGGQDDWLWLVAGGATAAPGCQEALLAAAQDPASGGGSVYAGMVLDAAGAPAAPELPAPAEADTARILNLVPLHALPIRTAGFANTLVAAAALREHGLPDFARFGPYAPQVWTSTLLAGGASGYLVAQAAVTLTGAQPQVGRHAQLRSALAAARSGGYTRGEAVRLVLASLA